MANTSAYQILQVTMIYIWFRHALAILADGRAMIGAIGDSSNTTWSEAPFVMAEVSKIRSCPRLSMIAVLMHDGQILVSAGPEGELRDITHHITDLLKGQAMYDIYTIESALIIRTPDHIVLINLALDGTVINKDCRQLPSAINLISFGQRYGLVRTIDNRLLQIADKDGEQLVLIEPKVIWEDFDHTSIISEIHCSHKWITLMLADGSVHIYRFHTSPDTFAFTTKVASIKGTGITGIVNATFDALYTLYLTTSGKCYYYFNDWMLDGHIPTPILVGSLSKTVIVKAYWVCQSSSFLVQDVDGKLSLLQFAPNRDRHGRIGEEEVVPITFFDDKDIVSVHESGCCTLFVSRGGQVYREYNIWSYGLNVTRYEFFDANPVAVDDSAYRIKSAGSDHLHQDF